MSKGQPIKIATRQFTKKGDAVAFFRAMLNRYKPGERVSDEDGKDLAALLRRHPDAEDKIGPGIDHFEVMSADYNTQCFWVVRSDQTIERFSFVACLGAESRDG
ncbi:MULTISPECIES: DCL family protein [unclassified Bradyrhizobium]|uniref:DCL family protein n=1 Tax=unclassified Bradyrhizobium TaxID=2631580 RepID=UPI001CD204A9